MKRDGSIVPGLVLIVLGAGALAAMNLLIVPMLHAPPAPVPVRSAPAVPTPTPTPPPAISSTPAPAASAPAPDAGAPATDKGAAAPLATIKFEPAKTVITRGMVSAIEQISAHLRKNPDSRAVITGHGDPGAKAADYVELGKLRAYAVRRALLDYGLVGARLVVEPASADNAGADPALAGNVVVHVTSAK